MTSPTHQRTRPAGSLRRRRKAAAFAAVFVAFALIAAACGSDDDDGDAATTDEATESTTAASAESEEQVVTDRAAGEATGEDTRAVETGPVRGGKLVYGLEADTSNPLAHYVSSCAISCRMILRSITDSLFLADESGALVPYLVEPGSVVPSEDFMSWTFSVREGIKFHDGTPLDGAAVAYNIDICRRSPLTGPAFLGLLTVESEGQSVTLGYQFPEAVGPAILRAETCGNMLSPTWLQTLSSNPLLSEDERAAAEGDQAAPVGVGAFVFDSYTPGAGNSFIAKRNPDYWRGANGITGEDLPYLDEIEFVAVPDIQGRSSGMKSGEFDIIHTANSDEIAKFEGDSDFVLLQANDYGETSHILLNVAQGTNPTLQFVRGQATELQMDPSGANSVNPLVNLSCRTALAHALDQERYAEERGAGIVTPANGPFPPGSVGYLDDSGYPEYDLDAAAVEWEKCKADSGQNPVTFSYNTTNDAFNVESNELIAAMWREAFGDEIAVTITPIEQGQYINLALAGIFQAQGWRNHGGVDPTEQWYWWNSATASPIDPSVPELALNFGRFQDPEMDTAFQTIRFNPDPAARKAATEDVNRAFGKNVWNIWTYWTLWGIVARPPVQNITDLTIPGHDLLVAPVIAGKHHLTQMWCTNGDCQDG